MARKPEAAFKASVHRYVKTDNQGMFTPYSSGTPDHWYSGAHDLWVEYKYLSHIPRNIDLANPRLLTKHQQNWIKQKRKQGRTVWVILGCYAGGVVVKRGTQLTREQFWARMKTRKEIAQEIDKQCRPIKV